jgi:DNA adenine methylase
MFFVFIKENNMKAITNIKRPAFQYYGGKWNLAFWIIKHFPPHQHYIEPCGGAASALLQKPRSFLETYNDIDDNVVNFFQVLRDNPSELTHKIELTPWARSEYELHREPTQDPIEAARRFWIGCSMSISGISFTRSGMRMSKGSLPYIPPVKLKTKHLLEVAKRFKHVQIENKPFDEIVRMYDYPNNLIYVDPPYVSTTRKSSNVYHWEWSEQMHRQAAELLKNYKGYSIVSGYTSKLYSDIYYGWKQVNKEMQINGGGKRIESLWLSPYTWEALQKPQQLKMF